MYNRYYYTDFDDLYWRWNWNHKNWKQSRKIAIFTNFTTFTYRSADDNVEFDKENGAEKQV